MLKKFLDQEIIFNNEGCTGTKLRNYNGSEIVQLKIDPKITLPPHTIDLDILFIITNGEGEIIVDKSVYEMVKGDSIEVKKGIYRGWKNLGVNPLEILAIKSLDQ